ncbi:MAG: ribonuclease HII [Rhodospirillaceae bacterium]|nr:ribonuclease HII [Rhodospirillaceae bacterium]
MPDFSIEDRHKDANAIICGVDEAGRGPWAGPVVAGAVVLDSANLSDVLISSLDDSKKLKPHTREQLFSALQSCAAIGVGISDVGEIDRLNILQATMMAMKRAVADLGISPQLALVDGNRAPDLACPVQCVIKGDGLSLSIAAASIIAKVTRDRIMGELAVAHPGYGWHTNQGYGTKAHQQGLKDLGITAHHRKSFAPIRKIIEASA